MTIAESQTGGLRLPPSSAHYEMRQYEYFDPFPGPVANPGKGTMGYVFSDHMYLSELDRFAVCDVTAEDVERLASLPWLDHLHLRVEWRNLQKEPSQLDLPEVWIWTREAARRHGKRWSFRVMPVCPQSLHETSVPEYLEKELQFRPYRNEKPRFVGPAEKRIPVYNGTYLAEWERLLSLLAREVQDDPLLDFVDVSGYGKWGEWHHWPEVDYESPGDADVGKRLIDDHVRYLGAFPAVLPVVGNPDWKDSITMHALARRCGIRRDTFPVWHNPWELLAAQARHPESPFVFEPGCFPERVWNNEEGIAPRVDFAGIYPRLRDIGATHVAVGFNPWHAFEADVLHRALLENVSKTIGWSIRPSIVWRSIDFTRLAFAMINDGNSPAPGAIRIEIREGGDVIGTGDLSAGSLRPGAVLLLEVALCRPPRSLPLEMHAMMIRNGAFLPVAWNVATSQLDAKRIIPKNPKGSLQI